MDDELTPEQEQAAIIVKMMEGNVPFFPRDEAAQGMIAAELIAMGALGDRGIWLARRYAQLYRKEWLFSELRALYCSKFRPADGVELDSAVYLDGIPSEKPQRAYQLAAPAARRIEAGRQLADEQTQVVDEELNAEVKRLAAAAKMPKAARTVEQIAADLYGRRDTTTTEEVAEDRAPGGGAPGGGRRITEADFEGLLSPEQKARQERNRDQ